MSELPHDPDVPSWLDALPDLEHTPPAELVALLPAAAALARLRAQAELLAEDVAGGLWGPPENGQGGA
jgi:hypothetical protein